MKSLALKTALIALSIAIVAVLVRRTPAGDFPPAFFWVCLALAIWVPMASRHGLERSERAEGIRHIPAGCVWAIVAVLLAYPLCILFLTYVFLTVPWF